MRVGLPLLAAICATTSSPTCHVPSSGIPIREERPGHCTFSSGKGEAEGKAEDISFLKEPGALQRTLRLEQGGICRPPGQPLSRLPLLGTAPTREGGTRISQRQERTCQMGSLLRVPTTHPVCSNSWQQRDIQERRTFTCGCCTSHGEGQGHRAHSPRGSGDFDHQGCGDQRCEGIPSEEACQVGERGESSSDQRILTGNGLCYTASKDCHRGFQESGEARSGDHTGEVGGGDGGLGGGQEVRTGHLSPEAHAMLLQSGMDYIEDANAALDELYGQRVELMEICCPTDSRLTETFLKKGRSAIRIGLPAFDFKTKAGLTELKGMLRKHRPALAWFSLPCGPYSPLQTLFNESTPEAKAKSEERKRQSRKLIRNGIEAAREQLLLGGHVGWEWPSNNGGWNLREMRAFLKELEELQCYHRVHVDGCAFGLLSTKGNPLRKPWKIVLTSETLAAALGRRCPGHAFHDECIGGEEARKSGFYPQAMCDAIQRAAHEMINETQHGVFAEAFPVFDTKGTEYEPRKAEYEPLTENERKASQKLLDKLHRKTGHPSNTALAATLRHRGAHPEVLEMAKKLFCDDCQELRMAPLHDSVSLEKSETLWETLVIDNAEFPADGKVMHCLMMIDEASRLLCPHFLFEHSDQENRNCTGQEAVEGIRDSWIRHYGAPACIRLDPEGAFRSGELPQWCSERSIEVLPCVAESHGQIGIIERAIQTVKATVRQLLQSSEFSPWEAVVHACQSHNELDKIEGYTPYQWAFGRQPTHAGRFHDKSFDDPFWTSSAVPGSSMATNLKLRVRAQQTFLRQQAQEQVSRALNAKTRRNQIFLPGDMVYFKRVKPPAQPAAATRMGHKLWRWYGPGRVLASETRSDAYGCERRPTHVIWIVTHGRLKRCSPDQLRHASERERMIAENSQSPSTTWTFHSMAQTLVKGEFEILDQNVFPGDGERMAAPRTPRARSLSRPRGDVAQPASVRSRSVPRSQELTKTSQKFVETGASGEEAHQKADPGNMTLQELLDQDDSGGRAHQKAASKKTNKSQLEGQQDGRDRKLAKVTPGVSSRSRARSSDPSSVPTSGVRLESLDGIDLERYLRDPAYEPTPSAVVKERPTSDLFQQPLFKKQRKEHFGDDDPFAGYVAQNKVEWHPKMVCTLELPLPETSREWKRLKREPQSFFVKKVRSAEVKWHLLSPEKKEAFQAAKQAEVDQWIQAEAVKRAVGPIPKGRTLKTRWVLTYKESGAPKARIVLIGYQDPDLESLQSSAPTMSRRTRQVALQYSSVRQWRLLKADVKAAFLQGEATEKDRLVYALPVPELAAALGVSPNEAVQVLKACYGLVTAPARWFQCISKTLKELGFHQCKSDPCLWIFLCADERGEMQTQGYICSHVDDFIISGNEQCEVVQSLGGFSWAL